MKKRTMNELRQTKECYVAKQKVLSDVGFDTNEEMKQIAACVKEIEQMKKRTLNELRQVKEFGWTPEPTVDDAIKTEMSRKQDEVAKKLDMILDLEDVIRTEMIKAGLHPAEYPEYEFELYKAFEELFEYALKDLRYHYFASSIIRI